MLQDKRTTPWTTCFNCCIKKIYANSLKHTSDIRSLQLWMGFMPRDAWEILVNAFFGALGLCNLHPLIESICQGTIAESAFDLRCYGAAWWVGPAVCLKPIGAQDRLTRVVSTVAVNSCVGLFFFPSRPRPCCTRCPLRLWFPSCWWTCHLGHTRQAVRRSVSAHRNHRLWFYAVETSWAFITPDAKFHCQFFGYFFPQGIPCAYILVPWVNCFKDLFPGKVEDQTQVMCAKCGPYGLHFLPSKGVTYNVCLYNLIAHNLRRCDALDFWALAVVLPRLKAGVKYLSPFLKIHYAVRISTFP